MNVQTAVAEFHEKMGVEHPPVSARASVSAYPTRHERTLRINFLHEEFGEYVDAEFNNDVVAVADALADIVYVAFGTALVYGIDLNAVLAEVHASNMTKTANKSGKAIKGPTFRKPDVRAALGFV